MNVGGLGVFRFIVIPSEILQSLDVNVDFSVELVTSNLIITVFSLLLMVERLVVVFVQMEW